MMAVQATLSIQEPARRFLDQAGPAIDVIFGGKKNQILKFMDSIPPKAILAAYLRAGLNYERKTAARIFGLGQPREIGVIIL